jgi:hypothetical protein
MKSTKAGDKYHDERARRGSAALCRSGRPSGLEEARGRKFGSKWVHFQSLHMHLRLLLSRL